MLKILIGEAEEEEDGDGGQEPQQRKLRALGVRYLRDGVCHEGTYVVGMGFLWNGSRVLINETELTHKPHRTAPHTGPPHTPLSTYTHIHTAFARQEVVLSAGAYNSPKLLMLSGIGDCRHLEQVQMRARRRRRAYLVCFFFLICLC